MIILYAATRNLYRHLPAAMRSLMHYNAGYVEKIIVLAEDDRLPEDLELPDCVEVRNAVPYRDKYLDHNSPSFHGWFSWHALLRVAYPVILTDLDKVLSLDVDTIVCDDITPIWDTDLTGKWFAMVPEMTIPMARKYTYRPPHPVYCNCGVLLMNLKQIRDDGWTPKLIHIANVAEMDYIEQDIFNHYGWGRGKIVALPKRYNESIGCGYTDDPAIQHFAGVPNKWIYGADFYRHEMLDRWQKPVDFGPEFAEA